MATVTGLTAERMKSIEAQSIVDARLEGDNLILTTYGEQDINVGSVRGPQGEPGTPGVVTTINGKAPTNGDVTITAEDLGAVGPTSLASAIKAILPPGTVLPMGRTASPTGFLVCDGRAVSRQTYADLFAAISTRYGAGDGSTTFNIPDFRARTPVGLYSGDTDYDTLGEKGGSKTHKLTIAEMPSHDHGLGSTDVGATVSNSTSRASGTTDNGGNSLASGDNTGRFDKRVQIRGTTLSTGGGTAFDIVQPYQVVNFMIKF